MPPTVFPLVALDSDDQHVVRDEPLPRRARQAPARDGTVLRHRDLERLRGVADAHVVDDGGALDRPVEVLRDEPLWVLHDVDADLPEDVHVLRVVDDRDDLRDLQFLAEQGDHDVRRVLIGRADERVRPPAAGLLQRIHDRRIVVQDESVEVVGRGLGPLLVALDDDDLVPVAGCDPDEGGPDVPRTDDDEIRAFPSHSA